MSFSPYRLVLGQRIRVELKLRQWRRGTILRQDPHTRRHLIKFDFPIFKNEQRRMRGEEEGEEQDIIRDEGSEEEEPACEAGSRGTGRTEGEEEHGDSSAHETRRRKVKSAGDMKWIDLSITHFDVMMQMPLSLGTVGAELAFAEDFEDDGR